MASIDDIFRKSSSGLRNLIIPALLSSACRTEPVKNTVYVEPACDTGKITSTITTSNTTEEDCTPTTWFEDNDVDGYGNAEVSVESCDQPAGFVDNDLDCLDYDSSINPAASEVCDNVDNNCDGFVDDEDSSLDQSTQEIWFQDLDEDSFGNSKNFVSSCYAPEGFVANNTDCDDTKVDVNPYSTEVCDNIDNDCNSLIDDQDSGLDLSTARVSYRDNDSDGFGDLVSTIESCDIPSGYVSNSTDCNDNDSEINPSVTEICDGIDNDCDYLIDDDDTSVDNETEWFLDADSDGYGDSSNSIFACDQPSGRVSNDNDCNDYNSAINAGATEICDDIDNDCDGRTDDDDAGMDISTANTWYLDSDGDGFGDLENTTLMCDWPLGYSPDSTDCNDSDYDINPDSTEICDEIDNNCNDLIDDADSGLDTSTGSTFYLDSDSDGFGDASNTTLACESPSSYVSNSTDCDDLETLVNPDATEICDDIDNDCNSLVDDEDSGLDSSTASTFYFDSDEDGFGDPSNTTQACDLPSGYLENSSDCDDSDANINPTTAWFLDADSDGFGNMSSSYISCEQPSGFVLDSTDCDDGDYSVNTSAIEVCDGYDNNCDELIDDADSSLDTSTANTFYLDADEDGYGDSSSISLSCEVPSGYVTVGTDCDDNDSLVSPGLEEICDEIDNNCDSVVDEGVTTTYFLDADGDGYGDSGETIEACSLPSGHVSDSTDCDDLESLANPGLEEICADGIDNDCDGTSNECELYGEVSLLEYNAKLIGEEDEDRAGFSVSEAGDVNGDGLSDIIIGAIYHDSNEINAGAAYILFGEISGYIDLSLANVKITGEKYESYIGGSISNARDTNNDGFDDVLLGARYEENYSGVSYLFLGPITGELETDIADSILYGEANGDYSGTYVSKSGDVNNDSFDDILIGAPGEDSRGNSVGATYLIFGPISGEIDLSLADAKIIGENESDSAANPSFAGDINGDGLSDIIIGAIGEDSGGTSAGAAYLIFGSVTGELDLSLADAKITGEADGDLAGNSVSNAKDMNGDGNDDILIGAYKEDSGSNNAGATYVFFGPVTGTIDLSTAYIKLLGESSGDESGCSISGVGDTNGDNLDDILIGVRNEISGGNQAGAAYLIYGMSGL